MIVDSYVDDIANRVKGKKVLDAGCCASTSKNLLKRHNIYKKDVKSILGIDYNKSLLKEAKSKFGVDNLRYCDLTNNNDVDEILNEFGTFEAIISTDVIEHIGNLTLYLDNLYRLLDNGGLLYLTTPNMPSSIFYKRYYELGHPKINIDHVCWFDATTLKVLLERSNFKLKKVMYHKKEAQAAKTLGLKFKEWMCRRLYVIASKEI